MNGDLLGRSHRQPERAPRSRASALFGGPIGDFDTEPADHVKMRSPLAPHFSPRHLRTLQSHVEALTTELLDAMADQGPPADLLASLARPLPIRVICELLGVPYADRDRFGRWVDDCASVDDQARSEQGLTQLLGYGMDLVVRKRADPGDDVLSRLCEDPDLSDFEVATLGMQLLFAGYETTVIQTWLGAFQLLTEPGRWRALLDDPTLIATAVEESLRAGLSGGIGVPRYAREDIEIAGVTLRAGELVLLDTGSANHDPVVFDDPDGFDLNRHGHPHVSFGFGPHYCVGAALARLELNTVFGQLIPRFPGMRLAFDPADLEVSFESMADGLVPLPVAWD